MNSNKKVLMIAATPFFSDRGCHIRIYNEIKYLKKEGVDVVLCTYHLGNNIDGFDIKRTINVPWYKKVTPGASWHKIYLDLFLLISSCRQYFKIKPKIIHAHLYEGLLIAFFVKVLSLFRAKIVFDCQGSLAEEMYQYTLSKSVLLKPFYYLFVVVEKILLFIPNVTVCSSENSYNLLKSRYHIKDSKIQVLRDAIDNDLFKPVTTQEKLSAKVAFDIPSDNIVILYTGSLTKAKGVKELLDSVPELVAQDKNLTFIFAGYGDLEEEYEKKYQNLIKGKNVFFTGRFSYFDLGKYISLADYAIDSKKDSSESSGKLFNYMAGGLPVICFRSQFNFSLLGEEGIYINNFAEVGEKVGRGYTVEYQSLNGWEKEIKKLIKIYV